MGSLTPVSTPTFMPSNAGESVVIETNADALEATVISYGLLMIFVLAIFSFVRNRYPKLFNVRASVPDLYCDIAANSNFGGIDWIWNVFKVDDEHLLESVGLDAVCTIRFLHLGFNMAFVGCLNALVLIPVYMTAEITDANSDTDNWLSKSNIGYLRNQDQRLYATVISSYIFFGSAMYLILQEFKWYTTNRHKFLSRLSPENYTVFVSGLPPEIRSSATLLEHFRKTLQSDEVYDATIAVDIPKLDILVAKRAKMVDDFEHLVNVYETTRTKPAQFPSSFLLGSSTAGAIKKLSVKILTINSEIAEVIDEVEELQRVNSVEEKSDDPPGLRKMDSSCVPVSPSTESDHEARRDQLVEQIVDEEEREREKELAMRNGDGRARNAGFVSFKSLMATASALQMIHSAIPFEKLVFEAPLPKDVFWANVGIRHRDLQGGKLLALALTIWLCIFWTIPVTFVTSLTKVETLKKSLPFLDDTPQWVEDGLKQVAPLALIGLVAILPVILIRFARMEGHISETSLQASLFTKLSLFIIIQTFFVSAISGSILMVLEQLKDDAINVIVSLLAGSLPEQATYFMQYVIIQTTIGTALELLRIMPLIESSVRSRAGPNLTQKERDSVWMGLHPVSSPKEFDYAKFLSERILYFMVVFVYNPLSPVTCFIVAINFLISIAVYRHQFIFIYPPTNDTGGKLFPTAMNFLLSSIVIAQITIWGVLGLKKGAAQLPFMVLLMFMTLLFRVYIGQQHFKVAEYLPSTECALVDKQNSSRLVSLEFLKDMYLQPSLKCKILYPNNLSKETFMDTLLKYETNEPSNY